MRMQSIWKMRFITSFTGIRSCRVDSTSVPNVHSLNMALAAEMLWESAADWLEEGMIGVGERMNHWTDAVNTKG